MSDINEANTHCLCGAIRVTVKSISGNTGVCHCTKCRKWGGGPLMAVNCGTEVSFEGAENIATFDSSARGERGFCRRCGTHLFFRVKSSGQYMMPAGLFGDRTFVFKSQIFMDEKPAFYDFANDTVEMTGAEVFARSAPPPK